MAGFCEHINELYGPTESKTFLHHLDDWLTVHHSTTLVNFQLDAQNSYLYTQLRRRPPEDEQGNARNM